MHTLVSSFEAAETDPFDLVVDLVGGDYELRSLPLLRRPGGHFAHVINSGFVYQ
jgi:NADPH:quinone reductase-like Zn-dependent oxidoreductase